MQSLQSLGTLHAAGYAVIALALLLASPASPASTLQRRYASRPGKASSSHASVHMMITLYNAYAC